MYLLYLDDSGSPNNPKEDYFVLGGVCVPEASIRWLSSEIDKIAQKYCPANPDDLEFHAAETFSGKTPPWNSMTDKRQRVGIIQEVLKSLDIANQEVVTFACAIHKPSFPNEDPVLKAYEEIASRFDLFLSCNHDDPKRGLIIFDKTSYEQVLQKHAKNIRRTGNRWGRQNRAIVEVPMFTESTSSRIIQLADHIAYAVFRRYNSDDLTYFKCIDTRFYKDSDQIHGLIHKHNLPKPCTCPYCLTRNR